MSEMQRGIGSMCHGCGYVNDDRWLLQTHVCWANGHGTSIRYSCAVCGQVEDRTYMDGVLHKALAQSWKARRWDGTTP